VKLTCSLYPDRWLTEAAALVAYGRSRAALVTHPRHESHEEL